MLIFSSSEIGMILRKRSLVLLLFLIMTFIKAAPEVMAENPPGKPPGEFRTFTLYFENDMFRGTDRQYTNGVKLTWISRDLQGYRDDPRIPEWGQSIIEHLPFINRPGTQRKVSFSMGQSIYTPERIQNPDLTENDRPYAGISYFGMGLHSKDLRRMDTIEISLGLIGPHSYADKAQRIVHELVGSPDPKGWRHQLPDEPFANLFYDRKWRFKQVSMGRGMGVDWIPHLGGAIGNAWTGISMGAQVRLGWNLPNDFGTFLIRPGSDTNEPIDATDPRLFAPRHRLGGHVFAGVDGHCVVRNVLLDGNTFRDSHSVKKKPLVGNFVIGLGVIVHRLKVSIAHVYQTREFDSQREAQSYGSITASFSY